MIALIEMGHRRLSNLLPRRGAFALAAAIMFAGNSHAAIVESLTTSSIYTYDFVPGLPGLHGGSDDAKKFHLDGGVVGQATSIDMNYGVLAATDASFFFLHNIQCKGYCSVSVSTWVVDTITNTGPDPVSLRFDSDITAGHLGLVANSHTQTSGIFDFQVTQQTNGIDHELYKATGDITWAGAEITTSDGSVFNNITTYRDGAQLGLDWDRTGISLVLDVLAPGETTTLTYQSLTYLNSYGICLDVVQCDGVQVAFGDPRNNGGIIISLEPKLLQSLTLQPVGYVLDRGFDMAKLRAEVVDLSAVPESGSWAMMIVGFAMTGVATRRRMPRTA